MKPKEPRYNDFLADWVRKGGALIYCGEDIDPYQSVLEWWNSNGNQYKAPSEHLFEKLGLDRVPAAGTYPCGKGMAVPAGQLRRPKCQSSSSTSFLPAGT